ncbi:MAG: aldehyde-activating protein, partial [Bradyrhizobium sp.]|nr:aldehyde-activating protein [Bradyrhizobium sp.]
MFEVQCPCGSAHLRIRGEPVAQFWCHCADCQQVHGAAYVAESVYAAEDVELAEGKTIAFALKTTPRVTCAGCGTRLFAELTEIGMRGVSGYLLPKGAFNPAMHLNCAEAVAPVLD